jgi:CRISPR/Cas system-associated exonuclease Cas4 (RecB family)
MLITNPKDPPLFQYCKPDFPEDCYHNISPSSINLFFTNPSAYYLERMEGNPSTFQGNTSSLMGTICHKIYEIVSLYPDTWKEHINREIIEKDLYEFVNLHPDLGIDVPDILTNYPLVSAEVVNNYILKSTNDLIACEKSIVVSLKDGVYLGGTIDRIEHDNNMNCDIVVDYKNVSKLPVLTNGIPFNYKVQLLAYAYALNKEGFNVKQIRIVYGIKPTKTIPARCMVITEDIDSTANKLIKDTLQLITESVLLCKSNPELIYIIFKNMELKR